MHNFHQYKSIPQNYIAEEILIGILLIYPQNIREIKLFVWKDIFFIESHQIIYSKLTNRNYDTFIRIIYDLHSEGILKELGGIKRITTIMKKSQAFICSNRINNYLEQIIKIIKQHYSQRLTIQLGYNIIKLGSTANLNEFYLQNKILLYFSNIENKITNKNTQDLMNMKDLVSDQLLNIKYQKTYLNSSLIENVVKSGFLELDNIIEGLPKGNLIILAGRPSIGKTSLAINIAYNCFFNEKVNLLIFSLEMSSKEIFHKFISIGSEIQINRDLKKNIIQEQWNKVSKICHKLIENNIYVNEENNIDIGQIELIAHNLKKKTH